MGSPVLVVIDPVTAGSTVPRSGRIRAVDPHAPLIRATDLGVTRGDGIFETLNVVPGGPQALGPHLARLQHSATLLDLPPLDLEALEAGVRLAVDLHEPIQALLVKVVVTRGIEGVEEPTAWAYASPCPDFSRQQTEGIRVVCLDRGYRSDVARTSPWLLQGAKTLSYAVNRAAQREAARRGAEDAIFISSDGYVLEGPSSSVLARFGDVIATPSTDHGILAGTTQAAAFDVLQAMGFAVADRAITRAELDDSDGVWLVSSGRQAVPVTAVDGRAVPVDHELTAALVRGLQNRTT